MLLMFEHIFQCCPQQFREYLEGNIYEHYAIAVQNDLLHFFLEIAINSSKFSSLWSFSSVVSFTTLLPSLFLLHALESRSL